MSNTRSCCCASDCPIDGIFGTDIDTGCCHKADTLLLWCNRPGHSTTQHYRSQPPFPGSQGCETCYTVSCPGMEAVQAIYHYHSCRFRFVYPPSPDPVSLAQLPFSGDPLAIGWDACANPICETDPRYCQNEWRGCCQTQSVPPGGCKCKTWYGVNQGGLNNWRYDQMINDPANLWFVELACHKDGDPLSTSPPVGRLGSDFIALVYLERWWKIAEDCPPNARIYVPGCVQTPGGSNCGGIPFVTSNLVPKWWIYAASGCPLYQFELDEALELGVIEAGEYTDIMAAINDSPPRQPPQPPLMKMAKAGYLVARDWRAEQRQAYVDLNALFPGAGYAACIQQVENMNELGPFRKRLTGQFNAQIARPILHKDDVVQELDPYQQLCMINYPGSWSNASDYDTWRRKQWVYFRGKPGGWIWVDWNAAAGTGMTEEDAIAAGNGRGTGTGDPITLLEAPLESFRGEPRGPCSCTSCSPETPPCPNTTFCDSCPQGSYDPNACSSCGNAPVAFCNPPSACLRFTITPQCEGVHFVFSSYIYENDLNYDPSSGTCVQTGEYRCHYQVHSFLVEAKRSVDSWTDAIPYKCRNEVPNLPVFNDWIPVSRAHPGVTPMCNDLISPNPQYVPGDLCCGGTCPGYIDTDYDWPNSPAGCPTVAPGLPNIFPCPANGPHNPCPARTDCPPHSTQPQINCIGFTPDCDPTP